MRVSNITDKLSVRGLIITAPRHVALEKFDLRVPHREYVKVMVEACGLCTWEQRVYRGVKPTYPFWGGHEVCGVVDDVNDENVAGLKHGDRVAIALMRRCGQCEFCRRGLDNHCVYARPEQPGGLPAGPRGLSSWIIVPPYQVFRLSPDLSFGEGALVEPLACVLRSIEKARITSGDVAVVMGGGTMGLIHTVLLHMAGCRVIVCDEDERNWPYAREAGADVVLPLLVVDVEKQIHDYTERRGADAIFCIRGGSQGVDLAVRMASRGGRVVLYQSIREADLVTLSANDVHYREIQIVGTISQSATDFRKAADLLSSRPELLKCLKIDIVQAEHGRTAFERALERNVHRVMVSFTE
jgi:L-iditol 2-dehydrogenase